MQIIAETGWPVVLFCLTAVTTGAALQRIAGQGFGLVSTPLIALVQPEMLPSAVLLLGFVSGLGSAALDLSHINRRELPWGFAGRALGAIVAAQLAALLPSFEALAVIIAVTVLLAVGASLSGVTFVITRANLVMAGIVAGLMGTLTAIGAPPMAMLYQTQLPARSRAMQSTFFFFGMVVSIAALAMAGLITARHVSFALVLLPGVLLGIVLSQPLARLVRPSMVRPMALGLSSLASLILLARALF